MPSHTLSKALCRHTEASPRPPAINGISARSIAVSEFYSSMAQSCGIAIFSAHLAAAVSKCGISLTSANLRHCSPTTRAPVSLLHYTPSGYVGVEASDSLDQLLTSLARDDKLCVILHGAYINGETRFQDDGISVSQERHLRLIRERADVVIALSDAVGHAFGTWQVGPDCPRLIRIDHPGLFATPQEQWNAPPYVFLGGISRPKKNPRSRRIRALVAECEAEGITIWEHWTNLTQPLGVCNSWRNTTGLLPDDRWAALISNARAVLCPYRTRIQPVSGIISEAISARRRVLATSFDGALELQRRFPDLVELEDDLRRWPAILSRAVSPHVRASDTALPTWERFAEAIAGELVRLSGMQT